MRKQHKHKAGVGVCTMTGWEQRLLRNILEKCYAGESLSFLPNVINYSVALNKNLLFVGKPDRVSFNLMFAEPSLLSLLPDVEHMLGSEWQRINHQICLASLKNEFGGWDFSSVYIFPEQPFDRAPSLGDVLRKGKWVSRSAQMPTSGIISITVDAAQATCARLAGVSRVLFESLLKACWTLRHGTQLRSLHKFSKHIWGLNMHPDCVTAGRLGRNVGHGRAWARKSGESGSQFCSWWPWVCLSFFICKMGTKQP